MRDRFFPSLRMTLGISVILRRNDEESLPWPNEVEDEDEVEAKV
ncbi:hypothetical protein [Anaerophaga thermohalophila]|nr:hypothetical protein [Anaerophaga thermohalophila]